MPSLLGRRGSKSQKDIHAATLANRPEKEPSSTDVAATQAPNASPEGPKRPNAPPQRIEQGQVIIPGSSPTTGVVMGVAPIPAAASVAGLGQQTNTQARLSPAMANVMEKQAAELRHHIFKFKVIENRRDPELDYSAVPNHLDILVFGPTGSGKSSLIRTFYRALHRCGRVPQNFADKIIVKDTNLNEGTLKYVSAEVKPADPNEASSAILCHDTRGQIWMDDKEYHQVGLILDGRVRDNSMVVQRDYRYARLKKKILKENFRALRDAKF